MNIRDYGPADREACLALFDSNVPLYFAPRERTDFAAYLDAPPGPYLVMQDDDRIVGCGGWARDREDSGRMILCWGMINRERHRTGLGRQLMQARIARITVDRSATGILSNTSQHSAGFFSHLGFETRKIVPDGHAPGIDLHEMILRLDP